MTRDDRKKQYKCELAALAKLEKLAARFPQAECLQLALNGGRAYLKAMRDNDKDDEERLRRN